MWLDAADHNPTFSFDVSEDSAVLIYHRNATDNLFYDSSGRPATHLAITNSAGALTYNLVYRASSPAEQGGY